MHPSARVARWSLCNVVDADDAGNGCNGSSSPGGVVEPPETLTPRRTTPSKRRSCAQPTELIRQGYSDLTIRGSPTRFPKSKSLLYYHDGKTT